MHYLCYELLFQRWAILQSWFAESLNLAQEIPTQEAVFFPLCIHRNSLFFMLLWWEKQCLGAFIPLIFLDLQARCFKMQTCEICTRILSYFSNRKFFKKHPRTKKMLLYLLQWLSYFQIKNLKACSNSWFLKFQDKFSDSGKGWSENETRQK